MRKAELMKISLIAGVILFLLLSIAAACETAKCVTGLNKSDNSVYELKNSLNDLKNPASLL